MTCVQSGAKCPQDRTNRGRLRLYISDIVRILGRYDCGENDCEGCKAERYEAVRLAEMALAEIDKGA